MSNTLRLYRGIVASTDDPEGLGRVRLSIPRPVRGSAVQVEGWAAVAASPLGGMLEIKPRYGVGDSVLYAAERLPFVGAVILCRQANANANIEAQPLSLTLALGNNNEANIEAADGTLRLSTTAGQQVTLHANGSMEASCNEMTLRGNRISISAGMVTVEAGMAQFTGVVKCDTLIANSVVGASYTPGAGNVW
jgi:hypothetical protein